MDFFITITSVPASGPGAIAGFEIVCSCGDVQRYSLLGFSEAAGAAHLRWHSRNV